MVSAVAAAPRARCFYTHPSTKVGLHGNKARQQSALETESVLIVEYGHDNNRPTWFRNENHTLQWKWECIISQSNPTVVLLRFYFCHIFLLCYALYAMPQLSLYKPVCYRNECVCLSVCLSYVSVTTHQKTLKFCPALQRRPIHSTVFLRQIARQVSTWSNSTTFNFDGIATVLKH